MKKTISLFFALLLFLTAAVTVSAEEYEYEYHLVNDVEMVVPLPTVFDVFSREMTEDDPLFKKYGTDRDVIMNILEGNYIYLDGVTPELEITFSSTDSAYGDLLSMSDEDVGEASDSFRSQLEELGATVNGSDILSTLSDTFLIFRFTDATGRDSYAYITSKGGAEYAFTLRSLDGTPLEDGELEMLGEVATNSYSSVGDAPESFDFIENKTGLFFTVPEGWYSCTAAEYKEEYGSEADFDLMLYRFPLGSSSVYFTVEDLWEELDASQRRSFGDRSRMSDDALDKELIADWFMEDPDRFESVRYNGINYLYCENAYDSTDAENGYDILCTVRNGYLYSFEHAGNVALDSGILSDIADSAVYPSFEVATEAETERETERETEKNAPVTGTEKTPEKQSSSDGKSSDGKKDTGNTLIVIVAASVSALAVLAIVLIVVIKKKKDGKNVQPPVSQFCPPQNAQTSQSFVPPYGAFPQQPAQPQAQTYQQPAQPQEQAYQQPAEPQAQTYQQPAQPQAPAAPVCPGCGSPIPPTGKFCSVCGSRIRE